MPWSMFRQPIHFAPGATPIWFGPDCRRHRRRFRSCACRAKSSSHGSWWFGVQMPPPEWMASHQL